MTPLTVYRWELPSPVLRLATGRYRQEVSREERAWLTPCLGHLQRAEWRAAEDTLLALLASGELRTPGARAQASVGLAYAYRWGFEDARRAFMVLLPHLPEAVEVHVHTLAANCAWRRWPPPST